MAAVPAALSVGYAPGAVPVMSRGTVVPWAPSGCEPANTWEAVEEIEGCHMYRPDWIKCQARPAGEGHYCLGHVRAIVKRLIAVGS